MTTFDTERNVPHPGLELWRATSARIAREAIATTLDLVEVPHEDVLAYRAACPPKSTSRGAIALGLDEPRVRRPDGAPDSDSGPLGTRTDFVAGDHRSTRKHRAKLQRASASILGKRRLYQCGVATAYRGGSKGISAQRVEGVTVRVNEQGRACYGSVHRCGAGWVCPVCSPIITERRRVEVIAGMTAHRKNGGGICLVTLTVPHGRADRLDLLIDQMNTARRRMVQHRRWREIRTDFGWVGEIRALEVTHGSNGWHPHFHVLWLTERLLDEERRASLCDALLTLWRIACVAVNLGEPSERHGITVEDGSKAGEYATKWGFAEELCLANHKTRGKNGSRNPWALLVDAAAGDIVARELWQEFDYATRRKAALTWSKGLRARLGLVEAEPDDETIVAEEQETGRVVARLSATTKDGALSDWIVLVRSRRQLELLDQVEALAGAGADNAAIQRKVEDFIGRLRRLQNPKTFADHVLATFPYLED